MTSLIKFRSAIIWSLVVFTSILFFYISFIQKRSGRTPPAALSPLRPTVRWRPNSYYYSSKINPKFKFIHCHAEKFCPLAAPGLEPGLGGKVTKIRRNKDDGGGRRKKRRPSSVLPISRSAEPLERVFDAVT
ncbi:hypothetical protein GWI33_007635 [Rhynchophorus ferrugineus]|uniref:Uncharacterized protein n=1 Tax=Rhynchophorus ferrugineus TaxID=354439 RepID=A0A834ID94_RHYFE|nr:hypothetical protein GWI33_007635 [Rhynchophorus ferrugineus]